MSNKRINKKQNERVKAAMKVNNVTEEKVSVKKTENEGNTIGLAESKAKTGKEDTDAVVYSTDPDYKESLSDILKSSGIDMSVYYSDPVDIEVNLSVDDDEDDEEEESTDIQMVEENSSDSDDKVEIVEADKVEAEDDDLSIVEMVLKSIVSKLGKKKLKRFEKICSIVAEYDVTDDLVKVLEPLTEVGIKDISAKMLKKTFLALNDIAPDLEEILEEEGLGQKYADVLNEISAMIPEIVAEITGIDNLNVRAEVVDVDVEAVKQEAVKQSIVYVDELSDKELRQIKEPVYIKPIEEYWKNNKAVQWYEDLERCRRSNVRNMVAPGALLV